MPLVEAMTRRRFASLPGVAGIARRMPKVAARARSRSLRSPSSASAAASRLSVATEFTLRPSRAARAVSRRWTVDLVGHP